MIDRASRNTAAKLTREFRNGLLTNDDLEEQWPIGSEDRALKAVGSMLWRCYDDLRVHTLTKTSPEMIEELSRYAAFLDTDLAYEWSEDRFDTIDWRAVANRLTLGLLPIASGSLRRREAQRASEGDISVWPFIRAADQPDLRCPPLRTA